MAMVTKSIKNRQTVKSLNHLFILGLLLLKAIVPDPLLAEHQVKECPSSLVLYYSPSCWHSQKVLDYLNKNQLSLPMKDVSTDGAAKEELRVKGGLMIVPCLIIDNQPLYDSDTIIQWIKDNQTCLSKI